MKKITKTLPFGVAFLPFLAFADANPNLGFITGLIGDIGDLVAALIPLAIAIGVLFFIWGLVQYIAASGDEAAKEEGKRKMIWGIIALFVIVSLWGLVALLQQLTGVDEGTVEIDQIGNIPGLPRGN